MVNNSLLEKKNYTFEQLVAAIDEHETLYLQDLLDTEIDGHLSTLFMNHTLVIKDVENISFITYDDDIYIHGIIDVFDRVQREERYNAHRPTIIANDHLADIIVRSDIVMNVIELQTESYIQESAEDILTLPNTFLIEIYTDWHTQMHFKDNEYARYFLD